MTLTPEQTKERFGRLGGTDTAAALGMSRYKTSLQLYREKRGEDEISEIENNAIRMGTLLEPVVRQVYSTDTGRIVRAPGTVFHPHYDWMVAHVDGVVAEEERGWEGKSCAVPNPEEWGEEGTDNVPQEYLLQSHKYMIVTGLPTWDLSVITGRFRVRHYTLHADKELHEMIIEGERDFIRRVREADPPQLDYKHKTALDVIKKMYPGTNGKRIVAENEEVFLWRRKMEKAARIAKAAGELKDAYRVRLLEHMGEAALLAFPDGKAFRRQKTQRAGFVVDPTEYIDCRFINDPDRSAAAKKKRSR